MTAKKYLPIGGLILAVFFFQTGASLTGHEYYLTQLTMAAYYAIVIIGLSILMGYAGQISIGHAGFFAMGGYITAYLTTLDLSTSSSPVAKAIMNAGLTVTQTRAYGAPISHITPWVALAAAILLTALVALIIGVPILKLKGHYLAMATLGFGVIIYRIVLANGMFGEADGISDVPGFTLFGTVQVSGDMSLRVENYYIAWVILIIGMVLLLNLINSRAGRALRSIHGSEEAAGAMGVNTRRYKLAVFVLSAVYAAIGGFFLTHFNGGIGPSEASVMKSVRYLAIVAVGGMANIWGALVMGVVLNYISLRGYFGSYDDVIFGAILIFIMLFYPDGLLLKENFRSGAAFFKKLKEKMVHR